MPNLIVYGLGGYCENCDKTHNHPLNNIVEIVVLPDESAETPETLVE
jgi:hypothetical protein